MSKDLETELCEAEDRIAEMQRDAAFVADKHIDELTDMAAKLIAAQTEAGKNMDLYESMRALADNATAIAERREQYASKWREVATDLATELRNFASARTCWQLAEFDELDKEPTP